LGRSHKAFAADRARACGKAFSMGVVLESLPDRLSTCGLAARHDKASNATEASFSIRSIATGWRGLYRFIQMSLRLSCAMAGPAFAKISPGFSNMAMGDPETIAPCFLFRRRAGSRADHGTGGALFRPGSAPLVAPRPCIVQGRPRRGWTCVGWPGIPRRESSAWRASWTSSP